MKSTRANELLVSLALAILCSGCSPKPLVPLGTSPERRANIRGGRAFPLKGGATLVAIDGQTLLFENSADVAPGPHIARICFEWPLTSYLKCEDLPFTAEAGHAYVVCGDSRGYLEPRVYLWIEDERTGRVVAGGKP